MRILYLCFIIVFLFSCESNDENKNLFGDTCLDIGDIELIPVGDVKIDFEMDYVDKYYYYINPDHKSEFEKILLKQVESNNCSEGDWINLGGGDFKFEPSNEKLMSGFYVSVEYLSSQNLIIFQEVKL